MAVLHLWFILPMELKGAEAPDEHDSFTYYNDFPGNSTGIDTIRAYGAEDSTFRRYTEHSAKMQGHTLCHGKPVGDRSTGGDEFGDIHTLVPYIHLFRNGVDPVY